MIENNPARSARSRKRIAGVSAVSLALGATVLAPSFALPAFATSSCPSGSTEISAGLCEVRFTATPGSTWTPVAGTTKLQALLVGAGGSSVDQSYGGGGGDVRVVELGTTGAVSISVGQAGTNAGYSAVNDSIVSQGATTETAEGGRPGGAGGGTNESGNGNAGGGGGGGAGNVGGLYDGGPGLTVNTILIAGQPTLFSDVTDCYGGGGPFGGYFNVYYTNDFLGQHSCGAGYTSITQGSPATHTSISPFANSGGGGAKQQIQLGGGFDGWVEQDGAAGLVVLRFEVEVTPEPEESVLTLTPGFVVGDQSAGAPVTLSGTDLLPNSAWNATVYSAPTVIASGLTDGFGAFLQNSNLPSGLESGRHRLVLTGTANDNSVWTRTLYVTIDASGIITYMSMVSEEPDPDPTDNPSAESSIHTGLASAGFGALGTGLFSAGVFLLGGAIVLLAVRRSKPPTS